MDISKIKFIESAGKHRSSDSEIMVSKLKDDGISITIRKNAVDRLLNIWNDNKPVPYLMIAVVDNRLYLKGTSSKNGFRVTKNPNTDNRYCRIPAAYHTDELREWIMNNQGEFTLKYDSEARLHYIEPNIKFLTKEN